MRGAAQLPKAIALVRDGRSPPCGVPGLESASVDGGSVDPCGHSANDLSRSLNGGGSIGSAASASTSRLTVAAAAFLCDRRPRRPPPFRRMWNVAPAFNVSVVIPISFATASRVRRRSAALGCCDPVRCVLRPAGTPGGGCRSASLSGSSVCSTLTLTCRSRVGDSCSCTCPWTLTAPCGTCSSGGSPAADSVTVLRSPSKRPYLVDRVDVVIAEHEPFRSRRPAPPVLAHLYQD